jgi:hypothetical protein
MSAITVARMRSCRSGEKGRRVSGPAAGDADGPLELDPVRVDGRYVDAEARHTAKIVDEAAKILDFSQPAAVMALMILQYIPDTDARTTSSPG